MGLLAGMSSVCFAIPAATGDGAGLPTTYRWTGAFGTAFEERRNWININSSDDPTTPDDERWGVPGPDDQARFDGPGSSTVVVSDSRVISQLEISGPVVTLSGPGNLTIANRLALSSGEAWLDLTLACKDLDAEDATLRVGGVVNVTEDILWRLSTVQLTGHLTVARYCTISSSNVDVSANAILVHPTYTRSLGAGVSVSGISHLRVHPTGRVLVGDLIADVVDAQVQVGWGSSLILAAGVVLEADLVWTKSQLGANAGWISIDGTVIGRVVNQGIVRCRAGARIDGTFRQESASQLKIQVTPQWSTPALAVTRSFELVGGTLELLYDTLAPGWDGFFVAGRRHSLISSDASLVLVGRFERFLGSWTGRETFLGLDYLTTGKAVDLIILRIPRVNGSIPYTFPAGGKLVLVTHGWNSSAAAWPDLAALEISQTLTRIGHDEGWTVVSFDWQEFAASGLPQGAAHMAHEIGESLALWTTDPYFRPFEHVHVIAHSAGSWLADGLVDRLKRLGSLTAHTTFLDAFVPDLHVPGETTDAEDELGDTADWADQYYESGFKLGTFTDLESAVNFDVTDENCESLPDCHAVPVEYYRNSVTSLLLPVPESVKGFAMSLEVRGDLPSHVDWPRGSRVDRDGKMHLPDATTTALALDQLSPETGPSGAVRFTAGGGAVLTTGSPASLRVRLPAETPLRGIRFDHGFLSDSPGRLTTRLDGVPIHEAGGASLEPFDRAVVGTGLIPFDPPLAVEPHVMEFYLEPSTTDACSVLVTGLVTIAADGTVPVGLSFEGVEVSVEELRLRWYTPDPTTLVEVLRSSAEGDWTTMGTYLPDPSGIIAVRDGAVTPGATYGYRLVVLHPARDTTEAIWVDVPPLATLDARLIDVGTSTIHFRLSLPAPDPFRLELFDVGGRLIASHHGSPPARGPLDVALHSKYRIRAGVHMVRVRQGAISVARRVLVLR